jgi:hypothetical protein
MSIYEQHVPEWYSSDGTGLSQVSNYLPVPPTQPDDPMVIISVETYGATEIIAGPTNRVEVLAPEDGEIPSEYWYEEMDDWDCETEEDIDRLIAEEVERIEAFIARVKRVGPTDYGQEIIDRLEDSLSDEYKAVAKTALMEYIEVEGDELIGVIECNGTFDRQRGQIVHGLGAVCPVHGQSFEIPF